VALRPSRTVAAAVALAHAAALAAAMAGLPPPAAAVVAVGLALSAFQHLRLALHRTASAVSAVEFGSDGGCAVAGPDGQWREAVVCAGAVPASWLAVLVVRDSRGTRRPVVVVPDSAEADGFRRLRIWLRWRPAAGEGAGR
jgi:toxin CptA